MAQAVANIISEAVNMFINVAGSTETDGTGWTDLGWMEAGSIKITEESRSEVELHSGGTKKLNIKYKLEAMALETLYTQIQGLETLEDSTVDIVLVKRTDLTAGYHLQGLTLVVAPELEFNTKAPRKLKVEATIEAAKLTDFFSELTGLTNYS